MQINLKKQLLIAGCIYVGSMIVGVATGWTAPIVPKLQDPDNTPFDIPVTDSQSSYVGSLLYVGLIFGPYTTGLLSNIIGRKPCLIIGSVITIIAFILLAVANNVAMVYAGRVVCGLGISTISILNMVYLGEIASTKIRGILLTATSIFTTLGTLIVYSIGPYVSYAGTNYIGLVLTFIYLTGIIFIPETPVFDVLKGQEDKAIVTLLSLGRKEDIDHMIKSKQNIRQTHLRLNDWLEIFTVRINRRTLFISLTLNILQQTSGVVAVVFFATTIFEIAGSSIEPNIATIIIGVAQISASSVTPFFVERAGRKSLLMFSSGISAFSLAVFGLYFHLDIIGHPAAENLKWLPLVTLIIFLIFYDFGFGIIPGTLMGEMYLPNVRSTGSTVVATVSWFVGFWVSTYFRSMLGALGGDVTFWIFTGSCVIAFLFTLFFVPETKGKSLFEIHELLDQQSYFYLKFK